MMQPPVSLPRPAGYHRAMESTVVVVPGYEDSDPGHWQSLWCAAHPDYRRLTGLDWSHPVATDWAAGLDALVRGARGPIVIVAHSVGALTVAAWGADAAPSVTGALLVAPPDSEDPGFPDAIEGYAPMPSRRLPFRSILVASRTDPWIAFDRCAELATRWGSELVDAGDAGHLNVASGHGPWPRGERLLQRLIANR